MLEWGSSQVVFDCLYPLPHVPGVSGVLAALNLPGMCLLCYVGISVKVGPPLSYPFTLKWDFGLVLSCFQTCQRVSFFF